ncbi:PIG-L family deacetylase [Oceaniglobus ichthyenteri]|uniref:PIG-L family deacetylase n=1 Tax=Oceaniglobus ichthyenteri TaxID=2136177 RepID=UPI000D3513BC|nr:PIG-L family deacetylase [Oceaniglobus ichthyenteri]
MPLSDRARIAAQHPHILQLHTALLPLGSIVSFMNTGAHPDDETSAMLAALRARGLDLSYACSTRGEGGQNDIGTESGADLGALRTAEMERAAQALSLRLYWLGDSADDPITDFGFSKSGVETLGKWGRERTLSRFVHILRRERPDIICPTFLDIPGQHGHHRAMTEAAHLVMDLAADPAFSGCDLPPWQVKKLFLPAWSGAGQAYDDDLPPPPATTVVPAKGRDPITGWSFEQIGQQSRVFHATQAMGRWVPPGAERDWPLHLADSRIANDDGSLTYGLATTLADLAAWADAPELTVDLAAAQREITSVLAAFPATDAQTPHRLARALHHIRQAQSKCPDPAKPEVLHRLARKEQQLAQALRLACHVTAEGYLGADFLRPGDRVAASIEHQQGAADNLIIEWALPVGWHHSGDHITVAADAPPHDPYRDTWLADAPDLPALRVTTTVGDVSGTVMLPLLVPPVVLPPLSCDLTPDRAIIINRRMAGRDVALTLANTHPQGARPDLTLPDGWTARRTDAGFDVTAPRDVAPGAYDIALTLNGASAMSVHRITQPHIAPTARATPAAAMVRVVDVALPDVRLGYIGGGHDRVDHWLGALGFDVATPDPETISDAELAGLDTIVIGIFALKFRAGLAALMPRLHEWVAHGGTLLTLYHRPWDDWNPEQTPPRRLEIGQPSLRWRVTDETARVTHLHPDHPLLNTPNRIGPDTWADWHKERGLYFAKSWDGAYIPLLEMADPGEASLQGALLAADIGKGRHIHTSLILHHQMAHLTPGAFALMANLCAKRG